MRPFDRFLSRQAAYFFAAPVALIIFLLILVPIGKSVVMSFTDWYLLPPDPAHPFVGLKNFRDIVELESFRPMVVVTIVYTVASVVGKMLAGLGTALLLNRDFYGRGLVRAIMIIPWAIPTVVVAIVFRIALNPVYGMINVALLKLGLIESGINFLAIPNLAVVSVIVVGIWKYFPFITLMLLAALQSIPKDLYDVASIDGAGTWNKFRHITWPLIAPVWSIVLVLQLVWTLREFELVYLITRGGPANATSIIGVDIYQNAFNFFRLGTAAAEGMFLVVISLVFALVYFRFLERQ